ncbi:MAG: YggS family pyridoxal phosphate-dependent enzyme [Spirochaetaceae bacterium]|jgi:pyridoxal phosphate enzyme (YggS family)|nr:YggS family pyridoxal phosphate-dependent enzyme [Spirochaetaceae bacterium]
MAINENLQRISGEIDCCCQRIGRKRDDLRLMAVSKFHSEDKVLQALNAGQTLFGESRVKEATEKFSAIKSGAANCELHLIGTLQRNKAKQAVETFDCVQSVDRDSIISELGEITSNRKKLLPILLELNSGEESKSGYPNEDSLFFAAEKALGYPYLKLSGLMTIAPFTDDDKIVRTAFANLAAAQVHLQKRFSDCDWSCLSMGMSSDFKIAIEEGSTLIRIGTSIFGERA